MTRPSTSLVALCSAMPVAPANGAPEFVHLLPAGVIRTHDGRGPYTVKSMDAIAQAMNAAGPLPIDECHAIDRAAPEGRPAPARGWIVSAEARDDGLWGKVEWTGEGQALMADKAYRGISPVISHSKAGEVLGVLRASLINTPNLVGLASLHSEETGMDWKAKLIELLGLDSGADDAAIEAALKAKMEPPAVAEQGQQGESEAITALQGELATVTGTLTALQGERAREKAEAFVDAAIAAGRIGVKPLRDRYIAMHMADAANAEAIIGGLPKVSGTTHAGDVPPVADADADGLTTAHRQAIALMGLDPEAYKANLGGSAKREEAL